MVGTSSESVPEMAIDIIIYSKRWKRGSASADASFFWSFRGSSGHCGSWGDHSWCRSQTVAGNPGRNFNVAAELFSAGKSECTIVPAVSIYPIQWVATTATISFFLCLLLLSNLPLLLVNLSIFCCYPPLMLVKSHLLVEKQCWLTVFRRKKRSFVESNPHFRWQNTSS